MERLQKEEQLSQLKDVFSNVESIVLSSVEGLSTDQVNRLRSQLRKGNVKFKVFKNKLAQIAAAGSPVEAIKDDFVGQTAMAWSTDDAIAPAKLVMDFQKDVEKFQIKVGYNAGKRLDLNALKQLASLPSLDELRAQLLGLLQAVPARLLAQINAPASNLVGVLQAKMDKEKEAN